MLSLGCKASIKAVIFLASRSGQLPRAGIQEVAKHIGENEHTVGKLLQKLVKAGIIHSAKGPHGGFFVDEAQLSKPVIDIVHAIDGIEVFHQCGLGLSTCSHTKPCPMHDDYKEIRDRFEALCRERTVHELCVPVTGGMAFLVHQ
ncbi:MAG TPA: Rrf2 family transcriptional regulator [Phnomibacter sp.]|nr:Rrf2 family transcriptional regulator [Phnomibacter sp.]